MLCLIQKTEKTSKVHEFRPISITNADCRIVTRYWALWLAENIVHALSPTQNAIAKGRLIDRAVESVLDAFYERIADGKEASLLSTDFEKAYDYLNRDVIIKVLINNQRPLPDH